MKDAYWVNNELTNQHTYVIAEETPQRHFVGNCCASTAQPELTS
jgi:hypothetical protein